MKIIGDDHSIRRFEEMYARFIIEGQECECPEKYTLNFTNVEEGDPNPIEEVEGWFKVNKKWLKKEE